MREVLRPSVISKDMPIAANIRWELSLVVGVDEPRQRGPRAREWHEREEYDAENKVEFNRGQERVASPFHEFKG